MVAHFAGRRGWRGRRLDLRFHVATVAGPARRARFPREKIAANRTNHLNHLAGRLFCLHVVFRKSAKARDLAPRRCHVAMLAPHAERSREVFHGLKQFVRGHAL
jgi:hypothetical protein